LLFFIFNAITGVENDQEEVLRGWTAERFRRFVKADPGVLRTTLVGVDSSKEGSRRHSYKDKRGDRRRNDHGTASAKKEESVKGKGDSKSGVSEAL